MLTQLCFISTSSTGEAEQSIRSVRDSDFLLIVLVAYAIISFKFNRDKAVAPDATLFFLSYYGQGCSCKLRSRTMQPSSPNFFRF